MTEQGLILNNSLRPREKVAAKPTDEGSAVGGRRTATGKFRQDLLLTIDLSAHYVYFLSTIMRGLSYGNNRSKIKCYRIHLKKCQIYNK